MSQTSAGKLTAAFAGAGSSPLAPLSLLIRFEVGSAGRHIVSVPLKTTAQHQRVLTWSLLVSLLVVRLGLIVLARLGLTTVVLVGSCCIRSVLCLAGRSVRSSMFFRCSIHLLRLRHQLRQSPGSREGR